MRRKKILLIDFGVMFGGGQVYLTRLVQLLADDADFCAFCSNPKLTTSLREMNVDVYHFEPVNHWKKLLRMVGGLCMLVYLRLRLGLDIVWVNGTPEVIFLPLARLLGCTAIATQHLSMDADALRLYKAANRLATQKVFQHLAFTANRIVCVSASVAYDLQRIVPMRKLLVIPNWVPLLPKQMVASWNAELPLRLLFVGRLQDYKGASLILDAMHQLIAKGRAYAISLVIVGEGECLEELQEQAGDLDVKFAGFQRQIAPYYSSTDVFINPSVGPEGLPLVSLEAMSFGLPCIFSDLRVHREISDDGKAAILFQSADAADLCVKLEACLTSPEMLQQYGQNARNQIEKEYNPSLARRRYVSGVRIRG